MRGPRDFSETYTGVRIRYPALKFENHVQNTFCIVDRRTKSNTIYACING